MNWKLVLRIYGNLRQLTDDESALLSTLRAMNDTERELLVESLQPQKPAGKKAAKKRGSKSARASGMAEQLNKSLPRQRQPICTGVIDFDGGNRTCDAPEDDAIHDSTQGYAGYHPFVPPAQSAATASGD